MNGEHFVLVQSLVSGLGRCLSAVVSTDGFLTSSSLCGLLYWSAYRAAMPYVVTGSAVAGTHTEGDSFSIRIYVDIVANIVCYYAATGGGATWAQLGTDLTMSGDGKFFAEDEPI